MNLNRVSDEIEAWYGAPVGTPSVLTECPRPHVHAVACTDPEVVTGGPDPHPLKNHKNIGFFCNTGPIP